MDKKQEYLDYLQASFRDYFADIGQSATERAKEKSFINGLMVAGKIFGVTSAELQQALSREQSHRVSDSTKMALEGQDLLEIPTYIRFPKQPES
ncbi:MULTISPECIES: hypothetical protein [Oceanisphaera]|uniref:Uncharacterized protein n=1 Tax=Oceanisphaera ostreae TaxID=914151 RepID=A0ABW3KCJ6_9GAMM